MFADSVDVVGRLEHIGARRRTQSKSVSHQLQVWPHRPFHHHSASMACWIAHPSTSAVPHAIVLVGSDDLDHNANGEETPCTVSGPPFLPGPTDGFGSN